MKRSELLIEPPDCSYLVKIALGQISFEEAVSATGLLNAEVSCLHYGLLTVNEHLKRETKSLPSAKKVRIAIMDFSLARYSYTYLIKNLGEIGYTDVLFKKSIKFANHLNLEIGSLCKKWSVTYSKQIEDQMKDLPPSMRID